MPFDVEIKFWGLCGFVPDCDLNDPKTVPKVLTVLMPDIPEKLTLGKHPICVHAPCLVINGTDLKGSASTWKQSPGAQNGKLVILLDRKRVRFRPRYALPRPKKLEIVRSGANSFLGIPQITDIVPKFAAVSKDVFNNQKRLSARFEIDAGVVGAADKKQNDSVYLPGSLKYGKKKLAVKFAHECTVDFEDVTGFAVEIYDLDDPKAAPKIVHVEAASEVYLEFGNFCGDVLLRTLTGAKPPIDREADHDFAAYYKKLSAVSPKSGDLLPVPTFVKAGGAGSTKCHSAIFDPFV